MASILKKISSLVPARLLLAAVLTGLLSWGVLAMAPQPLIIEVDGNPVVYRSLQRTVGSVLAEAGIRVGSKDVVHPDLTVTVARGAVITVNRAVSVKLNVDGKSILVQTPKAPVSEVLASAGIGLGPMDRVSLPPAKVVTEGTVIAIDRISEQVVTERYQVPVPMERTDDPQMERGESRLVRSGTPGEAERQVRVTYVNGKPDQRLQLKDQVLKQPVSRLIAYGTVTSVSRGGKTINFRNSIDAVATAYSFDNGRYTCTGAPARFGVVAVDPGVIPLGTRLYVDGYGYATAADIGSAIRGNRIDVFFESEQDCYRWGRRSAKVYILE